MNRVLVVNADDFGRSRGVNEGVAEAHERGIVTSASLMVRRPHAGDAAAYARAKPALSVGLHVDLGEWTYREGEGWAAVYEVEPRDVYAQVARQLAAFRELVGRDPTHLDSHQHAHRDQPARGVLLKLARELGLALRGLTPGIAHCGSFYGQSGTGAPLPELVEPESLIDLLDGIGEGATEILCHPARRVDFETTYGEERVRELETLCDPRVAEAVAERGIRLGSFADVGPFWT